MAQVCFVCKLSDKKNDISHDMKVTLYADLFQESSGYIERMSKTKNMIEVDVGNIDFYDFYNLLNALVHKTEKSFVCSSTCSLIDVINFLNLLECDTEFMEEIIANCVQSLSYKADNKQIFLAYSKFPDVFNERSMECISRVIKKQVNDKLVNIEKYDPAQLKKLISLLE